MKPWIQLFSGCSLDLDAPSPDNINITDVAQSLSQINRYTGHTWHPYSVAQHSVLVARHCPPECQLEALLHDAGEMGTGDVSAPLKALIRMRAGNVLDEIEKDVHDAIVEAIAQQYGIELDYEKYGHVIKEIDTRIRHDEKRCLMKPSEREWNLPGEPLNIHIEQWAWLTAKGHFLTDFVHYSQKRSAV